MDRLYGQPYAQPMSTTQTRPKQSPPSKPLLEAHEALRLIDKRSYAVIATTSSAGNSHSAGVLYARSGEHLYLSTMRSSRKARNVAANSSIGVTIPVRRVPVGGPPSAIMFQAQAEVIDLDDAELRRLAAAGELNAVTSHGELELPDGCFIKVALPRRLHTYGLGMSLLSLIRNPLNAAGVVDLTAQFG